VFGMGTGVSLAPWAPNNTSKATDYRILNIDSRTIISSVIYFLPSIFCTPRRTIGDHTTKYGMQNYFVKAFKKTGVLYTNN
jgi:uncharacterized spore protein YtfJ